LHCSRRQIEEGEKPSGVLVDGETRNELRKGGGSRKEKRDNKRM